MQHPQLDRTGVRKIADFYMNFSPLPQGTALARAALRRLQKARKANAQHHRTIQIQRALASSGGQWKRKQQFRRFEVRGSSSY